MAVLMNEIDWVYLNPTDRADVHVGELVSADAGGMPIYQVMAVRGARAWLRNLADGSDQMTPLSAFHWKAMPAHATRHA